MTREDKLYSMKGSDLIKEADKLGIKVNCNKTRTQLSEAKSKVVERILAAEAAIEEVEETPVEEVAAETQVEEPAVEEKKEDPKPVEKPVKTEEEIPPFVYVGRDGFENEDYDIGEMIHKWSEEKKTAFSKWFDELISSETDLDTLDDMCKAWSSDWDAEHPTEPKAKKEGHAPTPKRGALIEYDGRAQNICKWGEELGISPNTLYGRIYKMGWTVERAFTTRPR